MDIHDTQNNEDKYSSWLTDENQGKMRGSFQPVTITGKQFISECSSSNTLIKENQLKKLEEKINNENTCFQVQNQKIVDEINTLQENTPDRQIPKTDQKTSTVKKLQRLASPEEEIVFKFGAAPKPGSYNIKRPSVEKITKEAICLDQKSSLNQNTENSIPTTVKVIQKPAISNTKFSTYDLRETISDDKTRGNHDRATSQSFRERSIESQFRKQYDSKNYTPDARNSSITIARHLSDSHIRDNLDFNTNKKPSSIIVTSDEYIDNGRENLPQSGTYRKDLISHQSTAENASDIQLTKYGTELIPRLPSKKPRIKKPFPDASKIVICSPSARKHSNLLEMNIDSNLFEKNNLLRLPSSNQISSQHQTQKIFKNDDLHEKINITSISKYKATNTNFQKKHPISSDMDTKGNQETSIDHYETRSNYLENSDSFAVQNNTSYLSDKNDFHHIDHSHSCSTQQQDNIINNFRDKASFLDNDDTKIAKDSSHMLSTILRAQENPRRSSSRAKSSHSVSGKEISKLVEIDNETALLSRSSEKKVEKDYSTVWDSPRNTASVATCKKIFESCRILVDMAKECEDKTEIIGKQKTQIMSLESSNNFLKEKTKHWETEAAMSKQKSERISNIYMKFQGLINKLIESQQCIKQQGNEISNRFSLIEALPKRLACEIKELKDEYKETALKFKNLHEGLKRVNKDIDESKRNLVDKNKKLADSNAASIVQYQTIEIEKKELLDRNIKLEAEIKTLYLSIESVKAQNKELESLKTKMNEKFRRLDLAEQEGLIKIINLEEKLRELTTSSNNEKKNIMVELNQERIAKEKVEKELECQQKNHDELIVLVKQTPIEVAFELSKEDSLITKTFNLATTTQVIVEETVNDIKNINKQQTGIMSKLFEDISSRIEITLKKQEGLSSSVELMEDILKDIKDGLSHVQNNQEAQEHQNATISSLQASNKLLMQEGVKLADEKSYAERRLIELESELKICEENLRSKTIQHNEAEVLCKENSNLMARVVYLESEKERASKQLEEIKHELIDSKEKGTKECNIKGQKIEELQKLLSSSEIRIKNLEDERSNYIIKELENKQNFHDFIKKAESSKATLKLKLETKVKNLDQKIKSQCEELEKLRQDIEFSQTESKKTKMEYQELIAEIETKTNITEGLKKELTSFKDQFLQQAARLQILENNSLEPQTSDLESRLRSVLKEVSELRILFQVIKNDNSQLLNSFSSDRQSIKRLYSLCDKNREDYFVGVEDLSLQESLEMLEASLVDPKFQTNDQTEAETLENSGVLDSSRKEIEKTNLETCNSNHSFSECTSDETHADIKNNQNSSTRLQKSVEVNQLGPLRESNEKDEKNAFLRRRSSSLCSTVAVEKSLKSQVIQKDNFKISTPAIDNCSEDISYSSSLTDVEGIIEVFPSVSGFEKLSQEYNEARILKHNNSIKKNAAPRFILPLSDQRITFGGLKRDLQHDSCDEIASSQKFYDRNEQLEPNFKRQKSVTKAPVSVPENSGLNSGFSRPTKSSLRSRIGRDAYINPAIPSRKTDFAIGKRQLSHQIKQQSPRTEPTESNVKQRRQVLKKTNMKGIDSKHETNNTDLASSQTKIMQITSAKIASS
ncbi:hypothetical protein OnM2_034011 [Erysiphe neolycopersici]|uniref:Uncharacterized protein n=1 Tax=Erysiphe neolycopersici TaxID=212602 RepID=A0A420HY41_9PEZI|nr:hypothetical protein OnM2_034011 [Erysiphe neolycopersici]